MPGTGVQAVSAGGNVSARQGAWLRFAAAMLFIGAAANALYGVAGLVRDEHLVPDDLLFGGITFWGGVNLAVGMIQLMIAVLIVKRVPSGASLGVLVCGINAVAQMMAIGAYPIWSVTVLAIDLLVIYALIVYGPRELA
jgi:hypothetical protein